MSKAQEEYTSFLIAQTHSDLLLTPQSIRTNNDLWSKPPPRFFKANWDADCNRKVGRLGSGAIIRDDKGAVVGTMRASKNFNSNPLATKACGLLLTAQFCKNDRLRNLTMECDSLQVINILHSQDTNWSQAGLFIHDATTIINSFAAWFARHIPRTANVAPHKLGKHFLNLAKDMYELDFVPSCILNIVTLECTYLV